MKKIIKLTTFLTFIFIILMITLTILNKGIIINNPINEMTATIINDIEKYGTDYIYDDSMPSTADPVVVSEGINGLNYTYDGLSYTSLSNVTNEIVKIGTAKSGLFSGRLTGYGPDCPGCSAVGNVSCLTRERQRHSLITDGIYYVDTEYGKMRILAADNSAFPCGTIVKVNNGFLDEFYGIVLDTGSTMRNAWKSGMVWMDLAFSSQGDARKGNATSGNTAFSIQRWGW